MDQDVVIAWVTTSFHETMVDSGTTRSTYLHVLDIVELQRELIGVGENKFLLKREC